VLTKEAIFYSLFNNLVMKYLFFISFAMVSKAATAQKHEIDLSFLISNYSSVSGQNSDATGNNILSYHAYGSLDYRLSYYYTHHRSNLVAVEVEAARKTMPTDDIANTQYLMYSYGIGFIGYGKLFRIDSFSIRTLVGFSLMYNTIFENIDDPAVKYHYLTHGFSFGADINFVPFPFTKRSFRKIYIKTGFRGQIELFSFNLKKGQPGKPDFAVGSIVLGFGRYFK
jgi:hypothetical protein